MLKMYLSSAANFHRNNKEQYALAMYTVLFITTEILVCYSKQEFCQYQVKQSIPIVIIRNTYIFQFITSPFKVSLALTHWNSAFCALFP
jgi:hypothetical protein